MKKTLALFLALITILSVALVACKKNTPSAIPSDDEGDDGQYVSLNPNPTGSDTSDTSGTTGGTAGWTERAGTVYVMGDKVRIRSQANSNNSSIITNETKIGDSFAFTAVNSKWYKITYNDAEAYISAEYVTENANEADFTTKKLTTPDPLTIETAPSNYGNEGKGYAIALRVNACLVENASDITIFKADVTAEKPLKKIAENASGTVWQVEYNGKTYYMGSAAYKLCDGNPDNNTSGGVIGGQG